MDVISSTAPYFINVGVTDTSEYKIYADTTALPVNLIYTGKVTLPEGAVSTTVPVNIQPILVNYIPDTVGKMYNPTGTFSTTGTTALYRYFMVEYPDSNGNTVTQALYMNFCTENATNEELGWDSSTTSFPAPGNMPLDNRYLAGTYYSATCLFAESGEGVNLVIYQFVDGTLSKTTTLTTANGTRRMAGVLNLDSSTTSFDMMMEGIYLAKGVEVIRCVPKNSYILYYVNSFGGIDYIICDKTNTLTYNADRHSITRYATIQDRTQFGKINYLNNTTRTWELNTQIMDDEKSKQMYKVFNSEYVWLYDIDKQQMNSVVIEDAALKIKKFGTEKIYNYTIKVVDSQTVTLQ